jgi:hypothetical protein
VQADADLRKSGCQHGAAAAAENEPEGADEFGQQFIWEWSHVQVV